ncbi:hypothetical protein SAMN05443549_1131, partial [Flavobacterium fluvii]
MKKILLKSRIVILVFVMANLFFSSTVFGQEPTVTLDQADLDYAPGETVGITGTGWKPGETVTLEVSNLTNPNVDCGVYNPGPHELWTTVADGNGNFTASWYVNDCELGAKLFLEAYGKESGFTFEIFFTDGNVAFGVSGPIPNNTDVSVTVTYTPASPSGATQITTTLSFKSQNTATVGAKDGTSISWIFNPVPSSGTAIYSWDGSSNYTQGFIVNGNYGGNNSVKGNYIGCTALSITNQPSDQTVTYGGNTSFTVGASNATSYQWEESTNGGGVWSNIGGATSSTLSLVAPTVGMNGNLYRCIVTSSCGTVTSNNATLTVNAKAITVSANAGQTKVYGAANPASYTYAASGFEFADDLSVMTGALARAAGEGVGAYAINQGTLSAGSNYSIDYTGADFAITAKTLTVAADSGQTKVYGAANPASYTYAASGFEFTDDLSVITGALARVAGEGVGAYAINQGNLSAGANYSISYTGVDFAITPKTLTVTADAGQTKVYGATDPTLTYTITGFVNGDDEADLDTPVSIARAAGEDVGNYTITPSGAVDANYTISFPTAQFGITKAALTVTANAGQTKVYGAGDPTLTYTITGFVNGDDEADLDTPVSIARAAGEDVGNYTITPSGAVDANYTISFSTAQFAITKAALTVTANAGQTKVYGATDPTLTYTITGFVNGDDEADLDTPVSIARAAGEDVGNYTITPSGAVDANYTISFPTAQFAITKAALTVTANAGQTKVYGATDPTLTYTITG